MHRRSSFASTGSMDAATEQIADLCMDGHILCRMAMHVVNRAHSFSTRRRRTDFRLFRDRTVSRRLETSCISLRHTQFSFT